MKNRMYLEFDGISENERFARVAVAAFAARLEPTMEEISDIKTAVSEGVTNAVIHGYGPEYQKQQGQAFGLIMVECVTEENLLTITIRDFGVGIEDVAKAREALYTTSSGEERSGMGFTFMELFMDSLEVTSRPGKGTALVMKKYIGKQGDTYA